MSNSDRLPDYPLNSDLVKRLKSALDARDEERVSRLICAEVRPVDAVIEVANDDWMKDPSAQLPPSVLVGLWTLEYKRELTTPRRTVQALLNHGSPSVWPDAFPKVLKTCAPAPTVIETLFNSYPQLRVSESWQEVIPEEVFLTHQTFYRSFFALARAPRCLQHLCRGAIRKLLGKKCFHLVPLLPLPTSLQNYLLLEPEGVLH
ncbi:ankyrin repeat and SOCS box protein 18 [Suricata suricatta]|uniref:ankyrin repeat and SOCS box protein 18 n=1 Tax=Suricata suricatta TaxID=37032 RepID=UPI0011560253|nr:ankyrin repeat and SOCS box protein 18 [Suricata suricatta]